MKILVLSDIHGLATYAEKMIAREQPDEVIFLGDGVRNIKEIAPFFKEQRFHCVQGNCDFGAEPEQQCITLGGKRIFFTHGHRFNVKMEREINYITLRSHAVDCGADIVLFGHTHQPDIVYMNGVIMLNPGAVMAGKYAVLEISGAEVLPELRSL